LRENPQGLDDYILIKTKLCHSASVEEPAGKCQADAAENNSAGDGDWIKEKSVGFPINVTAAYYLPQIVVAVGA